MLSKIPKSVTEILKKLEENNFEAYIVGGCVRDLMMDREPKDWDVTTDAKPEEIMKIFPDSFYENKFFTVGIKTEDENYPIVEVTTFRIEQKYSDKRHPDEVRFAETLAEDLGRRDFTINALAIRIAHNVNRKSIHDTRYTIIDLFEGQKDLKNKIIRAVGNPDERFDEDALRMTRVVRFACTLNGISNFQFPISNKIQKSNIKNQNLWNI